MFDEKRCSGDAEYQSVIAFGCSSRDLRDMEHPAVARGYTVEMAETWGDVVKKLKAVAAERGKPITDEEAKEVITGEYRELFPDGFDPIDPAPEISAEEYDNMADLTDLDR
jgi:hypothetical protein